MTRNDAEFWLLHWCGASVPVEIPRPFANIAATEQFGAALGNEFMSRAVNTPASHAGQMPGFGHGVAHHRLWSPLVKCRLEKPDERRVRHALRKKARPGDVSGIVSWSDSIEHFHGLDGFFVQAHAAGEIFGEHGLEANGRHVVLAPDVTRVLELAEAIFYGPWIVGHAFEPALVKQLLLAVRKIEPPPLDRGGT